MAKLCVRSIADGTGEPASCTHGDCRTRLYSIDILLPQSDGTGRRFPQVACDRIREVLTERFGGVTAFLRAPALGEWRNHSGAVERDEIVIFEVMAETLDREWWASYRHELELAFRQQEIVVRAVLVERRLRRTIIIIRAAATPGTQLRRRTRELRRLGNREVQIEVRAHVGVIAQSSRPQSRLRRSLSLLPTSHANEVTGSDVSDGITP